MRLSRYGDDVHRRGAHDTPVGTSARREAAAARACKTSLEVRKGLHAARPRDLLAESVVCVSWAAF